MPETRPSLFLSYARGDDEVFARQLYEQLVAAGHAVWFDRECMPSRALTFLKEIREAIRAADRVVVVIGPRCVASDYCRAEWQAALAESKPVTPVLRLGQRSMLPAELRGFHSPDLSARADPATGLRDLLRVLREPPPLGPLIGGVPDVPPHFQPRPDALSALASQLLVDERKPVTLTGPERVTVLHGMGGLGKSVITAAFARSTTTRRSFADGVLWLPCGEPTPPLALMAELARLLGDPPQHHATLGESATRLASLLQPRSLLIVLDNTWLPDQAEPLVDVLGSACRLLLTTRRADLAQTLGAPAIALELPDEAVALKHLADWAGVAPDTLPPEAAEVAGECGRLPFALALNGAMHQQGIAWADLAAALRAHELDFAEQRFKGYPHPTVLKSLGLSLQSLDAEDAAAGARLRELAAFGPAGGIAEPAVAVLWAHTAGLTSAQSAKTLARLTGRALLSLQPGRKARRVLIHDLQHDYLMRLGDVAALQATLLQAWSARCGGDWTLLSDDGYAHRHLAEHLLAAGREPELQALLDRSTADGAHAWFAAHTEPGGEADVLRDLALAAAAAAAAGDEGLRWRRMLMQRSVQGVLARIPAELHLAAMADVPESAEAALAGARAEADLDRRVRALLALVPGLQPAPRAAVLAECLAQVRGRADQVQARLLPAIAALLPEDERAAVVGEALAAARSIDIEDYRAEGLAAVLPLLDLAQQPVVRAEAVAALDAAADSAGWIDVLEAVLPLCPEHAPQALALAQALTEPFLAAMAFEAIVPHLPEGVRADAAREGIRRFEAARSKGLWIVISLSRHVPEADVSRLIERAARDDPRQMSALVDKLPELLQGAALLDALAVIEAELPSFGEAERIHTRIALLPHEDAATREHEVETLLGDLPVLDGARARDRAWRELLPHLSLPQKRRARSLIARLDDAPTLLLAAARLALQGDADLREEIWEACILGAPSLARSVALAALATATQDTEQPRRLEVAVEMVSTQGHRALLVPSLMDLAALLPPSRAWPLQQQAANACVMPGGDLKTLARLAPGWPAALRDGACRLALDFAAQPTGPSPDRDLALAVERLALVLSPELQSHALALVQAMSSPGWRWAAGCHLLPYRADALAALLRDELVAAAETSLQAHDDIEFAALCRGVARLLPQLTAAQRPAFEGLLRDSLDALPLTWIVSVIEAVSPVLDAAALEALAERAWSARASPPFAAWLAPAFPPATRWPRLVEALPGLAPSGVEDAVTADALAQAVQALLAAPQAQREQAWSQALSMLPVERARACSWMAGLAPLALSLDRQATLALAARATLDVGAWWP